MLKGVQETAMVYQISFTNLRRFVTEMLRKIAKKFDDPPFLKFVKYMSLKNTGYGETVDAPQNINDLVKNLNACSEST